MQRIYGNFLSVFSNIFCSRVVFSHGLIFALFHTEINSCFPPTACVTQARKISHSVLGATQAGRVICSVLCILSSIYNMLSTNILQK